MNCQKIIDTLLSDVTYCSEHEACKILGCTDENPHNYYSQNSMLKYLRVFHQHICSWNPVMIKTEESVVIGIHTKLWPSFSKLKTINHKIATC